MNIIERAGKGLMLLSKYCDDQVALTEAGNFLCVWKREGDPRVSVPSEVFNELRELGWRSSEVDGWYFPMSS